MYPQSMAKGITKDNKVSSISSKFQDWFFLFGFEITK